MKRYLMAGVAFVVMAMAGVAVADLSIKDGTGATVTMLDFICVVTGSKHCSASVNVDTTGTYVPLATAAQMTTLTSAVNGPIPAGTAIIGKVGIDQTAGQNVVALAGAIPAGTAVIGYTSNDACSNLQKSYLPITASSALAKVIAPGVSGKKIYICQLILTTTASNNVAVFEATTATSCATPIVAVYGGGTSVATAAQGFPFPANGGVSIGNGGGTVAQTANNTNDLCIATSAATPLTGGVMYVTQ